MNPVAFFVSDLGAMSITADRENFVGILLGVLPESLELRLLLGVFLFVFLLKLLFLICPKLLFCVSLAGAVELFPDGV